VTLLISACSKSKRAASSGASAAGLGRGSAVEVAREWFASLSGADGLMPAGERYKGRGHRHALVAATRRGAQLLIMSAGLGFVRPSDPIPAYHLTTKANEEDSILPRLEQPAGVGDWWTALEEHSPFSRRLEGEWDGSGLILVALPVEYLELLSASLEHLPTSAWDKLRVISGAAIDAIPGELRPYWLPYDARLNGPDSEDRGTGSDFLGRAAGHFLALIENATDATIGEHQAMVEGALKSMRPAERRQGRSLPDEAIADIIRFEVVSAGRGSARLLRKFRDELGIACEQKRFRRLYTSVITEVAPA
jgi:hypothetical protein